ncbi:IS66 family insertion sequence element accessory protein TnpB [Nitrospirillum viridazoti]|uniref:IS66 family insertion sequence element accessory protein TnpB n=1 Tax=Nitrospirillum viridazoti TaxID=3144925 RepID=UPI0009D97F5A|nr:IS66 family insertion sequence element accessory protein TnpB [Nitrospirillum amazonense]
MIPVPSGVRVWLAVGRTDMRRGMTGLALQVQEAVGRDPHAGDLHVSIIPFVDTSHPHRPHFPSSSASSITDGRRPSAEGYVTGGS